ncbi:hypothetical protein, unlikely [Trypanosoma brucei brucei TREU927]|uniref:Uncharacterized protein n=1 Tax=Trypanosoma brucei brucei (strain 927/4 GUTat10.1) TaxID=185431 RepID=Q38DI6_TRYB2|nr:hypothetical protein, unlikely [Trypanosoma brucei brucei TREU927]EAN77134.1 hypothetical protein, unlikely [Trypanosoma brucei brucei TREU927]
MGGDSLNLKRPNIRRLGPFENSTLCYFLFSRYTSVKIQENNSDNNNFPALR